MDAYRIRITNQLALSENIQRTFSAQVAQLLSPYGVGAARFFINGITSTTTGVDAVANYHFPKTSLGQFGVSLAANLNHITLDKVPTSTSVLSPAPVLYSRQRILSFEQGAPQTKIVGSAEWSKGPAGATLRATYYDSVLLASTLPQYDIYTGDRVIIDTGVHYRLPHGVTLAIGADNLLDTYPRAVPAALNPLGITSFSYSSPFGFNGRYLYGRLSLAW